MLSKNEVLVGNANKTLALYLRHNPGTELQLPYVEPLKGARNIFDVYLRAGNKILPFAPGPHVFSPVLIANFAFIAIIFFVSTVADIEIISFLSSIAFGILLITSLTATLTYLNFRLFYGRNWLHVLLGPTHVGLSRESIKLHWIGKLVSTCSLIVGWNEVLSLDAYRWSLKDGALEPKIRIRHKHTGYEAPESVFELSLSGFRDADECRTFLMELDRNVPE